MRFSLSVNKSSRSPRSCLSYPSLLNFEISRCARFDILPEGNSIYTRFARIRYDINPLHIPTGYIGCEAHIESKTYRKSRQGFISFVPKGTIICIFQEFYQECCQKHIPELEDIYMIKSGATTGRVSIVDTLEPKFTIWSPLAVFRCNREKLLPMFLFYALQSEGFQKQVEFGWTFGTQQNIGMRSNLK